MFRCSNATEVYYCRNHTEQDEGTDTETQMAWVMVSVMSFPCVGWRSALIDESIKSNLSSHLRSNVRVKR